MENTKTPVSRKNKLLTIGIIVLVLLFPLYFIYDTFFAPKPLGDKMEFIGRTYAGTVPFLSDSDFMVTYYYGTDLSEEEVVKYFKDAHFINTDNINTSEDQSLPRSFSFKDKQSDNPVFIYFYYQGNDYLNKFNLPQSTKKHVITLTSEDYVGAKNSL